MKRNPVKAIAVIEAAAVVILLIFAVVTYSFAEKRGLRGESVSPDGVYCAEIYITETIFPLPANALNAKSF